MILLPGNKIIIVNGPSKFDLVTAFADRFGAGSSSREPQRTVNFTSSWSTSEGPNGLVLFAKIVIDSLKWEDGSGHNWIFEGQLTDKCSFQTSHVYDGPVEPGKITGIYNSKTHNGHFEKV